MELTRYISSDASIQNAVAKDGNDSWDCFKLIYPNAIDRCVPKYKPNKKKEFMDEFWYFVAKEEAKINYGKDQNSW